MSMKKLALSASIALAFVGNAHALSFTPSVAVNTATFSDLTALVSALGDFGVTTSFSGSTTTTVGPDITAISGAINTATVNGAIDITGTNVGMSSMEASVSAKAEAITGATGTATSSAYAIAGAKLSTTVIGAMNSATLDVMGRTTDLSSAIDGSLAVNSLAGSGTLTVGGIGDVTAVGSLTGALTTSNIISADGTSISLSGLTTTVGLLGTSNIVDLQDMMAFNAAINVASLDAGIHITAAVDSKAWFLNPQTGVVNLANIEMATTAIGAMNSSITRLGVNLAK